MRSFNSNHGKFVTSLTQQTARGSEKLNLKQKQRTKNKHLKTFDCFSFSNNGTSESRGNICWVLDNSALSPLPPLPNHFRSYRMVRCHRLELTSHQCHPPRSNLLRFFVKWFFAKWFFAKWFFANCVLGCTALGLKCNIRVSKRSRNIITDTIYLHTPLVCKEGALFSGHF